MVDAATKHKVSRITITVLIFGLFALLFLPFFAPILIAALFAFALEPVFSGFAKKPSRRKLPAIFFLIGFFVLTAGPIVLVFLRFSAKMRELAKSGLDSTPIYKGLEKIYIWGMDQWATWSDKLGITPDTNGADHDNMVSSAASMILAQLGKIASGTPEFLIGLFVFTLALYYYLTESKKIKHAIWSLDLLPTGEMQRITHELQKGSYITLVTSAVTGAIQATFVAVAGLIFGFHEFLIIFVVTFFVSFIPVIGAAPVSVLLALISLVHEDYTAAIGLAIAAGIAGSIDNIVRPYLATSDEEDISLLVSLLAIIGAVILFGF
ncbi:MAG: AI-2E family transporter, partial [Bdellovibrionota bacterium]